MAKSRIEFDGDRALQASLAEFPQKFQNKAMRKILRDTAKLIVKPSYERDAPKGVTRQLKRSRIRSIRRSRNKIGTRLTVSAAYYASFVILGTKWITGSRTLQTALFDNASKIKVRVISAARKALPTIAAEVRAKNKPKG